jgi:flagellar biosynthetic protein FlhB
MADDQERTEPASPRKREEARRRGHVARSADLSAAAVLLAGVLALEAAGGGLFAGLSASVTGVLGGLAEIDGEPGALAAAFAGLLRAALGGLLPLVLAGLAAAAAVGLAQSGFLFTASPMAPSLERIDPVAGFGRMLSGRSLARVLAGLLKLGVVAGVAALTLRGNWADLASLGVRPFEDGVAVGASTLLSLGLRCALALALLGLLDYAWQRHAWERDLRMSRAEVREELRRFEGDPATRERRNAVRRRLAAQRLALPVAEATVVVVNPAHLAVALAYDGASMDAPVLVAKGTNRAGERIREAALEHGVPVVERTDLARRLFKKVDLGQAVPPELYTDVAELLAYVARVRGLAKAA